MRYRLLILWRGFLFIPVWLLVLAMLPVFSKDHPWHGKKMTLKSWVHHGTALSAAWGGGLWFITATTTSAFWCLEHGRPTAFFTLALLNLCFTAWMLHRMFP